MLRNHLTKNPGIGSDDKLPTRPTPTIHDRLLDLLELESVAKEAGLNEPEVALLFGRTENKHRHYDNYTSAENRFKTTFNIRLNLATQLWQGLPSLDDKFRAIADIAVAMLPKSGPVSEFCLRCVVKVMGLGSHCGLPIEEQHRIEPKFLETLIENIKSGDNSANNQFSFIRPATLKAHDGYVDALKERFRLDAKSQEMEPYQFTIEDLKILSADAEIGPEIERLFSDRLRSHQEQVTAHLSSLPHNDLVLSDRAEQLIRQISLLLKWRDYHSALDTSFRGLKLIQELEPSLKEDYEYRFHRAVRGVPLTASISFFAKKLLGN